MAVAIKEYKKAIDYNPSVAQYYYDLGYSLNNLSQFADSIRYFDKAIELDENIAGAYVNKAHSLYNLEQYDECIEVSKKAFDLGSESLTPNQNIAWSYYKKNDYVAALKYCDIGLKIDPNFQSLLKLKLNILRKQDKYEEALFVTERMLLLDPDSDEINTIKDELNLFVSKSSKKIGKIFKR